MRCQNLVMWLPAVARSLHRLIISFYNLVKIFLRFLIWLSCFTIYLHIQYEIGSVCSNLLTILAYTFFFLFFTLFFQLFFFAFISTLCLKLQCEKFAI